MGSGIYFPISALIFCIIIMILFFSKKSIKSTETKIYKYLLVSNFIGLILELFCTVAAYVSESMPLISDIILKSYLAYNVFWTLLLTIYVYYISNKSETMKDKMSKVKIIAKIVYLVSLILIFFLRCDLIIKNDFTVRYTTGLSVYFTYSLCGVFILLIIYFILNSKKKVLTVKYIPIYSFLLTIIIGIIIQINVPGLLIMTYIETVTIMIMYFTIENPDIKMLNEVYKNKELMEQNYEDKYNFLFEITQEARNPLTKISSMCQEISNENDPNKIKLGISVINNLVKQLDFSINNVLNISSLDIQKLRFIDNKYDLLKMCDELVLRISDNINEFVNFKYDFPKVVPILYGDNMKIKQILYSLLINSAKYTKKGYIEFKVSILERYDVCRVIFTISDTGSGMNIEQINDILSITGELDKQELENVEKNEYNIKLCQKIIKIMGGNLMIKADVSNGTEVKLVIDQRIYHEKEKGILDQYEKKIINYKKVLIVSQDNKLISKIKSKFNQNNITYTALLYGYDAVDRIKSRNNYNYILISDEMKEVSGLATYQEMKKVDDFNTPVIIMLNKDKEHIKDNYLEEGFIDYILTDNIDLDLDRIINKY